MAIYTHDRIKLTSGLLAKTGILWGNNALQSITINRHTPKEMQQAIGYLGIVDYTSGRITSDVTLDAILVEGTAKANTTTKANSIYKYAAQQLTLGAESYVMTSFGMSFRSGAPATLNLGFLTQTVASLLDIQAQPSPSTGEESDFAVVMGDDGSGIKVAATWKGAFAPSATTVPVLNADGTIGSLDGSGLPACVQSLTFNARINRDQILDIRSAQPTQFITTYPIDLTADIEICELPSDSQASGGLDPRYVFDKLSDLEIVATALNKHVNASLKATADDSYGKIIGLTQVDASETVSTSRYRTFTVNFMAADLICPLVAPA